MKLDCKVIEDLLPLYHDGVCSEESRQLVQAHLDQCEKCGKTLAALDGEIVRSGSVRDELKPLESINKAVKKGKRKALLKGVAIMLAAVLLLFGGYHVWWYTQIYQYYYQFAAGHDPQLIYEYDNNGNILQAVVSDNTRYTWQDDTYQYEVVLPGYLSWSGQIDMVPLSNTVEPFYNVQLSVSRGQNGDYEYSVYFIWELESEGGPAKNNIYFEFDEEYFIVDGALNQLYLDHWDAQTIARQDAAFEEYRDRVAEIVRAAQEMWPFLQE